MESKKRYVQISMETMQKGPLRTKIQIKLWQSLHLGEKKVFGCFESYRIREPQKAGTKAKFFAEILMQMGPKEK